MKYLLMIIATEDWMALPQEENARVLEAHQALEQTLRSQNKYAGGGGLAPSSMAKTVRRPRPGEHTVTDGPFAETKEVMGGFYLVECDSIEEAVDWAKQIPTTVPCSIEVRELFHG